MLPGNCVQTASLCRSLPDFHLRQDKRACQQRQTAVTPWASLLRVVSLSLPFHSVFFPFPPSSLSVSICLCWQAVLHIIHQDDLVVVEEGAPQIHLQTPSCPPLHRNIFWRIVFSSKLQSVCLRARARCAIIKLAKSHLREPFPPSMPFLWLATPSDEEGSIGRSRV